MRDIDLNQFWPQYAPPRHPAAGPAASATDWHDEHVHPEPAAVPPPPAVAVDAAARLHRESAIEDALAAASAGWAGRDGETANAPSAASAMHDDPEQLRLDLPFREVPPPPLAAPALLAEKTTASPAPAIATSMRTASTPAQREPAAPRKRRDFTPAIWGGLGFVAGVLVWHAVGFWSFVSDAVLNANDPRAHGLEAFVPGLPAPAQKAMSRIPESAVIPAPAAFKNATAGTQFACVALTLDRSAGITNAKACTRSAGELRDAGFNRRSDRLVLRPRLQDPVAWTGTTAVQVSEAAPAPAAPALADSGSEFPPLSDADLKLDLD